MHFGYYEPMPAFLLNSGVLFGIAKRAAEDAKAGNSLQTNALIAVVFSVVGSEAFINEAIELASLSSQESLTIAAFAEMGAQVEDSHGTMELKYQVAKWVFSGESFDKGTNPYQDFLLLIQTRNALVHYKQLDKIAEVTSSGEVTVEVPALINRLRSKGVLSDIPTNVGASWLTRISTPAMAMWACHAASAMVKAIAAIPPEGVFKFQMGLQANDFETGADEITGPGAGSQNAGLLPG
jgi:hypothetical protein